MHSSQSILVFRVKDWYPGTVQSNYVTATRRCATIIRIIFQLQYYIVQCRIGLVVILSATQFYGFMSLTKVLQQDLKYKCHNVHSLNKCKAESQLLWTTHQKSVAGSLSPNLLLSDAQNNTRSDWGLKFLGQDIAKQLAITRHTSTQKIGYTYDELKHNIIDLLNVQNMLNL